MHKLEDLTRAMRQSIAERLAEERLDAVNATLEDVKIKDTFYTRYGKRALDLFFATLVLLVTLPINAIIALVTLIDVGLPLMFTQQRTGMNGKPFTIVKFRNMHNTRDENGELLPPAQRVTKWGKFVRKTSLDELLNFWSIFKGDMSIIGPRPLLPEYQARYNKRHACRLAVRPGLECPPREPLDHVWTWQEQLDNDVWYVENVSFATDLKMCVRLVQFALDRKSAKARANTKRGTFMGYDLDGQAINQYSLEQQYIDDAFASAEESEETALQ